MELTTKIISSLLSPVLTSLILGLFVAMFLRLAARIVLKEKVPFKKAYSAGFLSLLILTVLFLPITIFFPWLADAHFSIYFSCFIFAWLFIFINVNPYFILKAGSDNISFFQNSSISIITILLSVFFFLIILIFLFMMIWPVGVMAP